VAISVWPLESDSNVIHADLFYSFLDQIFGNEGVLEADDLTVIEDTVGVGVKISPGGAMVQYDSAPGGKRVFYNSAESKSGPSEFLNPSFDVDTAGWQALGGSTVTRDTGIFHTSPASAKVVTNGSSTYTRGITSSAVNVRANSNQDTEVSCWVNAPAGVSVKLSVTEHDGGLVQIALNEQLAVATGTWLKITSKFKSKAGTRFLWVGVTISSGSSQTFYVDTFEATGNFEWIDSFKPANPTLPRIDRVVVQIRDQNVVGGGDTSIDGKFRVVAGTPTAGATLSNLSGAAAVPANSFLLANVLVPAGATVLSAANIDNAVRTPTELAVPASVLSSISTLQADIAALDTRIDTLELGAAAFPGEIMYTFASTEAVVQSLVSHATLTRITVERRITVSWVAFWIAAPAGSIDVGIYKYNDALTRYDRVWSRGAFTCPAAGTPTVNISSGSPTTLTLQPGVYWFALAGNDGNFDYMGQMNSPAYLSWDSIPDAYPLPALIAAGNLSQANRAIFGFLKGTGAG
jgi:hypothetical protein